MSDQPDVWILQCPIPLTEWELTEKEQAVYLKIQKKIDAWLKQKPNAVQTRGCDFDWHPLGREVDFE
jgi:hypothetical protein